MREKVRYTPVTTGLVWAPKRLSPRAASDYLLTLPDGRQLSINQTRGLTQVKDLNGNILTVSASGITHSSGVGIAFTRDDQGRITRITDPEHNAMTYGYADGDLVSFTDREENTTHFTYFQDPAHLLETIKDPRGITPIRNEYYDDGRIKSHTDAFGKTIHYDHDVTGRQEIVTDRTGATRVLSYDERGNVVKEIDPNGKVIDRTFDARNNRLSETLPHEPGAVNPPKSEWTYDARDNVLTARDPEGSTTEMTYNALNRPLTGKDPRGNYTINTYDTTGNLTATRVAKTPTGPALSETTYTYRAGGHVESTTVVVDEQPCTTTYAYNSRGNLTKEIDCLSHATDYTYDANGNRLTQTTIRTTPSGPDQLTTTYVYDRMNRLVKRTDPDGTFTRTEYDASGKAAKTFDKIGRPTLYDYDDMGRLWKTTFPDLTTVETTYDNEGRRLTSKDRGGRTTTYEYDPDGRLKKTRYPDDAFTENGYDAAGRLTTVKDARGHTTTYVYDGTGRRTAMTVPLGGGLFAETKFTYDGNGNQKTVVDANHQTTQFEYDEHNRRTKTIFPDSSFVETTYDSLGRHLREKDQAGKVARFEYDVVGRLVKVIDPLTHETTYTYDEVGNRLTQTDSNHHTTRFEYDRLGRETKRTLPPDALGISVSATKTYDEAGNLKTRIDFNGRTATYAYDLDNRLTSRTYDVPGQPSASFTYTPTGRRKTATLATGSVAETTTYEYDLRDRLRRLLSPDGRELDYVYDGVGNRTSLTAVVGGRTLTTSFTYDEANRLDVVTDPLGGAYDHGYDANGNRTSLAYANGVTTSYAYDALNRLKTLRTVHTPSTSLVQAYTLTLGPSGIRERIDEGDGTSRAYGYDDLYRVISETVTVNSLPEYSKTFTYDDVGNRLTQVTNGGGVSGTPTAPGTIGYAYDSRDRLLSETLDTSPPSESTYDHNGNLTARIGEATYVWDVENRLLQVTKADGTAVEHRYDVDGVRVETTAISPSQQPQTTRYLVDTSAGLAHVVAETNGVGVLTAFYVHGDDLIGVLRPTGGSAWSSRFVHADALGSIRRLTDETGGITDAYSYSAFGQLLAHTGTDPQPYAFTGEPLDVYSGFQYHRARWLDPRTGRFTGIDPVDGDSYDPRTLHKYLYAANQPTTLTDPSGKDFSLPSIMTSFSIGATIARTGIFAVGGALVGAFDAWVGGEDEIWLAAQSGAKWGGAVGFLWPFKAVQFVGTTLGFIGGGAATYDAFRKGRVAQGIFRGLLTVLSASALRVMLRPTPRADPESIAAIIEHLKKIDSYSRKTAPYNLDQVARLEAGKWSEFDQNFYQHEMLEARIMREGGYDVNQAHDIALEQLNHTDMMLYDPEVVAANRDWFNKLFPGF